jgi:CPA2 family monovalent cation:H+ antiporter-2
VGRRCAQTLEAAGYSVVVAETDRERVEELRAADKPAVSGDASEPEVLVQAHVARARALVIAIPEAFRARQMIETARLLNPQIITMVRTHDEEASELLRAERVDHILLGEHELAASMAQRLISSLGEAGR